MSRFTISNLRADIAKINGYLLEEGSDTLLVEQGRNNYQGVDEYPIDAQGNRIGSGVNRNVCCGTPRECSDAAWSYYDTKFNALRRAKLEKKAEFADTVVALLRDGCTDISTIYELAGLAGLFDLATLED